MVLDEHVDRNGRQSKAHLEQFVMFVPMQRVLLTI